MVVHVARPAVSLLVNDAEMFCAAGQADAAPPAAVTVDPFHVQSGSAAFADAGHRFATVKVSALSAPSVKLKELSRTRSLPDWRVCVSTTDIDARPMPIIRAIAIMAVTTPQPRSLR